jgi:hypothetical protein
MHPPCFSFEQTLSDWPACILELTCCKGTILMPVLLLLRKHGDSTFNELLQRLRCEKCGSHPAPIYLCACIFGEGGAWARRRIGRSSWSGRPRTTNQRSPAAGVAVATARHAAYKEDWREFRF